MSENDKNEQPIEAAGDPTPAGPAAEAAGGTTPTGPAPETASGSGPDQTVTDSGHGWRPSADEREDPAATPPADAPAPSVDAPTANQPENAGTPWAPPAPTYLPGAASPYPPAPQPGAFPTAQYPSYPAPSAGYPGAPTSSGGYPGAPTSSGGYPGAPTSSGGYPGSGGPAYGTGPGGPAYGTGPGYGTNPAHQTSPGYGTNYAPAGGYQPAAGHQPQPEGRRRGGRALAGLLAAGLVVALAGGAGGAAIMHAMDNDTNTTTASGPGSAPDNAPILDRSSLASIAAKVSPSVVSITTGSAEGSGVILSKDGYVLTNNHVAATANGANVTITFADGTATKASLVGTDARTDLAVYKAGKVSSSARAATFGDSNSLRVGDTVLAIGSPLGLDGSVTAGIVSALNRTIDESSDSSPQNPFGQQGQSNSPSPTIAGAIQTDAAINPGNSGGALVNTSGEVVGINTAIATNGSDGNIGVGFAIPSNRAKTVFDDIVAGKPVSHPYIGIEVSTADGNAGAQVQSVQPNSPAASAGLKAGDLITGYNGQPVHTSDDLINDVQGGQANTSVALTVVRGGATQTIHVTLGEQK